MAIMLNLLGGIASLVTLLALYKPIKSYFSKHLKRDSVILTLEESVLDARKVIDRNSKRIRHGSFFLITGGEVLQILDTFLTKVEFKKQQKSIRLLFPNKSNMIFKQREEYSKKFLGYKKSVAEWEKDLCETKQAVESICNAKSLDWSEAFKEYQLTAYSVYLLLELENTRLAYFAYAPPWLKQDQIRIIKTANKDFYDFLVDDFNKFWYYA